MFHDSYGWSIRTEKVDAKEGEMILWNPNDLNDYFSQNKLFEHYLICKLISLPSQICLTEL